jgi:hypothetical protein
MWSDAVHPESQREAERNGPERSECTSGLGAQRTKLWQGGTNAAAPWQGARDRSQHEQGTVGLWVKRGSQTWSDGGRRYGDPGTTPFTSAVLVAPSEARRGPRSGGARADRYVGKRGGIDPEEWAGSRRRRTPLRDAKRC